MTIAPSHAQAITACRAAPSPVASTRASAPASAGFCASPSSLARSAVVGSKNEAVLVDGICEREGPLWVDETGTPRRAQAWAGPIGRVLGSGLPVVETGKAGLPADWERMVALPIHRDGEIAHIVAWYC